jgi:hypothetical protein
VTFTPQRLGQAHGQLRSRMFSMFASSQLGAQIRQRLVLPTLAPVGRDRRGREHDAYIEALGNLIDVTRGDPRGIADRPPPAPSTTSPPPIVGHVLTHPPSPQFLPPTVGSDWLDSSVHPNHSDLPVGIALMASVWYPLTAPPTASIDTRARKG